MPMIESSSGTRIPVSFATCKAAKARISFEAKIKDLAYVYNYTQDQIKIDQERADEQENKINKSFHAGGGGLLSTTQDLSLIHI